MAKSNCLNEIDLINEGRFSDDDIDDIISGIQAAQMAVASSQTSLQSPAQAAAAAAAKAVANAQLAAKVQKRNRLMNIIVRRNLYNMSQTAKAELGDASLGIEAAIAGINKVIPGGRKSVDARGRSLMRTYVGGLSAELKRAGVFEKFSNRQLSREISRELWDLSLETPTGRATQNTDAKTIASIIHTYRKAAIERENRAGSNISMHQGYITRQSHRRWEIRRKGFSAWDAEIRPRLDFERMEIPADRQDKFMQQAYEAITSGERRISDSAQNEMLKSFAGARNLAKKASAGRTLIFKSADDWFEYNERFGNKSLNEAIIHDFELAARNTAVMEGFGTNPERMFEEVMSFLRKKYRDDPKQLKRLQRQKLNHMMKEVTGESNIIYDESLAMIGSVTRAWQSMAKLGGVVITSVTDMATVAAERRFQGRSILESWTDGLAAPLRGITASGEQRQYMDSIGIGIDTMLGHINSRFSAQDELPGAMSKLMSIFFKMNLLSQWTDGAKRGVGMMISYDLANNADKPFANLDGRMQQILRQYGIEDEHWALMRSSIAKDVSGRKLLMPGEIQNISITSFGGKPLTPRQAQNLKDEMQTSLGSLISDRVEFASPTPGARANAWIRHGTNPGTGVGEAVRFLMQFKAFPITMIERVQGNLIYGRGAKTLREAILGGKADLAGIASYIAASTVLGYYSLQAKQWVSGKEFREPSPAAFVAGMMQGGGLGIYGDFLLGQTNRYGGDPLASAAGPTFGTINEFWKVWNEIRDGGEDVWALTLKAGKANIPFGNLFYTKAAMDYLIWYQLQEMLSPGYLQRMEERVQEENGQKFFLPPSQFVNG